MNPNPTLKPLPILCLGVATFSLTSFAQRVEVIERGPHHAVVQAILPDGTTNQFTQLQTGLNRRSEVDGQYIPASDEVELVNGVPLARKTQYQVIFGKTLDAPEGAVDLLMVDGRRVRARPMGIAYTEFQSGQAGARACL